jgi:hypothetical protein
MENKINCDNITLTVVSKDYYISAKSMKKSLEGLSIKTNVVYAITNDNGEEEIHDVDIIFTFPKSEEILQSIDKPSLN